MRRLAATALAAACAAACGGSGKPSPVSPSCSFNVSITTQQFGPAGGSSTVTVGAPAACGWTATATASWITIQGSAGGTGNGTVTLAIAASAETAERVAAVDVASQKLTITQSACEYHVEPAEGIFPADGGVSEINLAAQSGCRWTVEDAPSWATFEPSAGDGSARVSVRVVENNQMNLRQAAVRVATARLALRQAGEEPRPPDPSPAPPPPVPPVDCQYSVSPVQTFARRDSSSGEFTITTSPRCGWTASSTAGWLRVKGATSGTGAARIVYEADRNPANAASDFRKAPIEVRWATPTAGQNVWVWQFPGCATVFVDADNRSYVQSVSFVAEGGRKHLFVLIDPWGSCPWTTLPPTVSWVSLSGVNIAPAWSRSDADLYITLPANPSSARSTVLLVGEAPLTINQAGR